MCSLFGPYNQSGVISLYYSRFGYNVCLGVFHTINIFFSFCISPCLVLTIGMEPVSRSGQFYYVPKELAQN